MTVAPFLVFADIFANNHLLKFHLTSGAANVALAVVNGLKPLTVSLKPMILLVGFREL